APEYGPGVEQEIGPAEEAALDIDLRGADFRLPLEAVVDDHLVAVLADRLRRIRRRRYGIVGDRHRIDRAAEIDVDLAGRDEEAVVAAVGDHIAALCRRLQPGDIGIGRILAPARPLRPHRAVVLEPEAWLGAPGIPVLDIERCAVPRSEARRA